MRSRGSLGGGGGKEDALLLALKMEEGAQAKAHGWPLEAGKGKETDCSLEAPEVTQPCGPLLDF